MLDDLTPEQRAAVTHPGGPAIVLAGAGAGKTRVLCHRLAWLVDGGASPAEILALTFTREAAVELRARAEDLIGGSHETLRVTTFHAFARELARVHGVERGLHAGRGGRADRGPHADAPRPHRTSSTCASTTCGATVPGSWRIWWSASTSAATSS